nr:putative reverse transcriptase domain-containing protein [Tanacetum cinerariifolium]
PTAIVSDRDPCFTSRFWKGLQNAWGTRLKFSTTFHPEIDGQIEQTIQTLKDMLRSCALEWTGNGDEYLCLVEFTYNNSWHASIKAAPYELLYGQKCTTPICWNEVGEHVIKGSKLIEVTNEKVTVAKKKFNKLDQIREDLSLVKEPEKILDRQERVMRNKTIPFVKILWKNHLERETTWETEESMRASYPHFFL